MSNILITGASGQLGKAITEFLLAKQGSNNLKAMVRDAAKAADLKQQGVQVSVADYDDYESLLAAFKDVDKLYLVSGNEIAKRTGQQLSAVKAAKEAGVKHILYTSFQRMAERADSPIALIADSHLATEQAIKQSGLTYTILLDGLYTDVIPNFAGEHLLDSKTLNFPAGDGSVAFATRRDMAEASANILLDDTGKYDNVSIEIAGSEAVNWQTIAGIIAKITGEPIVYNSPNVAVYKDMLTSAQVPAEFVTMLAGFGQAIAQGAFEHVSRQLENILGRKPETVERYLQTVYKK